MIDRRGFYDQRATTRPRGVDRGFQELLQTYYHFQVAPGQRVLELGCGPGDLLAAVQPTWGVGVDFSPAMIEQARQRHPESRLRV